MRKTHCRLTPGGHSCRFRCATVHARRLTGRIPSCAAAAARPSSAQSAELLTPCREVCRRYFYERSASQKSLSDLRRSGFARLGCLWAEREARKAEDEGDP